MTKRSVIVMSPRTKQQFEELREQSTRKIFDASLELFGTQGYEATSIAQIAKLAGISKGLIYNYFDSKEDLLEAMVMDLMTMADGMMEQILVNDPRQMLENLIKVLFKWLRENDRLNRLLLGLSTQLDKFQFVHDLAHKKMDGYIIMLEDLLSKMNFPEAKTEARILATFFDGLAMHVMILKDDYPLADVEKMLLEKYCREKTNIH